MNVDRQALEKEIKVIKEENIRLKLENKRYRNKMTATEDEIDINWNNINFFFFNVSASS